MGIYTGTRLAGLGGFLALPWCCVLPAALSLSGAGAGLAAAAGSPLAWSLFALSVFLVTRANWLVWVRKQGARAARVWTVSFSLAAVGLWAARLAPYLAEWR